MCPRHLRHIRPSLGLTRQYHDDDDLDDHDHHDKYHVYDERIAEDDHEVHLTGCNVIPVINWDELIPVNHWDQLISIMIMMIPIMMIMSMKL